MVNCIHTDHDLYVPRKKEEAVKPSHSSVTEGWISHVAVALEKSRQMM